MKKFPALIILAAAVSAPAWVATKAANFSAHAKTCAAWSITVTPALSAAGLEKTPTLLNQRQAIVTRDDSATGSAALTKATTDAGYPSKQVS
jgi:mercuric ion binding protein